MVAEPERDYKKTLEGLRKLSTANPSVKFFASNQVIGEAYIAIQHHYQVSKKDARTAILKVFSSGFCSPLNGPSIFSILNSNTGCGLLDRLIADEYTSRNLTTLTNDKKMARLENAKRL